MAYHPRSFTAEASRSTLPPKRCDTPQTGTTTRVDVEADDAGDLLTIPEVNPWIVLAAVLLWCYAGALLVNAVFPL
jgi:hypothetical protein